MESSDPNQKSADAKPASSEKPVAESAGSPPAESAPSKPGAKATDPTKVQTSDDKVLKDTTAESFGAKPHVDETAPQTPRKAKKLLGPKILIPIAILMIAILAGGVTLLLKKPNPKNEALKKVGISLQNVSADAIKGLGGLIGLGNPKQTLTVSVDSVFKNPVTFEDEVNIKGLLNASSGLKVTGAAQADSLNLGSNLNVNGTSSLQGAVDIKNQVTVGGALTVTGSGSFNGGLTVKGGATVGGNLSVSGTLGAGTANIKILTVSDSLTVSGHIITDGAPPSVSATSRIGSGGNVNISGNDTAGTISIQTGASPNCGPSGNGEWLTVTFKRPFGSVPKVLISPVGFNSAKIQASVIRTPQNFILSCNVAPTAGTVYAYDYLVVE